MATIKQLHRSHNRIIAGVAGGLGEYLGIDPTLVRILFLAFALAGGAGVVMYLIAWIAIPQDTMEEPVMADTETPIRSDTSAPDRHSHQAHHNHDEQSARTIGGVILIGIGGAFLLQQTLGINVWRFAWPVGLIVVGLFIIIKRHEP